MVNLAVDEIGDWCGKRVLVRADFNVPLDEAGMVTDDFRIQAALPTIRMISDGGGRVILMSHLGRPDGVDVGFSLKPIAEILSKALNKQVSLAEDCVGAEVEAQVDRMQNGEIVLLENLRFHRQENDNDPEFACRLAGLAEVYVNDAFASSHRPSASIEGVTRFIKLNMAGLLMKEEIEKFVDIIKSPEPPFVAVFGGTDLLDKIDEITWLLDRADKLIICGHMSYAFHKAKGLDLGASMVDANEIDLAKNLLDRAPEKIELQSDFVAEKMSMFEGQELRKYRVGFFSTSEDIPKVGGIDVDWKKLAGERPPLEPDEKIVDIGAGSMIRFQEMIMQAKTIVWTGVVGDFKEHHTEQGSKVIGGALALASNSGAKAIAEANATLPVLRKFEMLDHMYHVSTGHRAFFEVLKGKELPGITALS